MWPSFYDTRSASRACFGVQTFSAPNRALCRHGTCAHSTHSSAKSRLQSWLLLLLPVPHVGQLVTLLPQLLPSTAPWAGAGGCAAASSTQALLKEGNCSVARRVAVVAAVQDLLKHCGRTVQLVCAAHHGVQHHATEASSGVLLLRCLLVGVPLQDRLTD